MILRVVLIKLTDTHATPEGRAHVVEHTRQVFSTLNFVDSFDVGVPADTSSAEAWDVSLHVLFQELAHVQAYAVDPDHLAYVQGFLNPRAEIKKAWNFEI